MALLQSEVSSLRKANEALSKRRRAKKTRVQLGGSITVQEAQDLLDQRVVGGGQCKIRSRMVVVQGGLVRRFGAVVCAASLAIMLELARRMQKHQIQLLLM